MAQTPSHEDAGGWADQADGAAVQTARAPFSDDERGRVLGLCVRLTAVGYPLRIRPQQNLVQLGVQLLKPCLQ